MSSTKPSATANEIINKKETVVANAEGKKKKKVKPVIRDEPVPVVEDMFATLLAAQAGALKKGIYLDVDITEEDVQEEDEDDKRLKEIEKEMAAIKVNKAVKALANKLPELVKAFIAERDVEIQELKWKINAIQERRDDAENGYLNDELLNEAYKKTEKPLRTKTGKPLVSIKSGLPRAEAVIGKGVMRDGKLKTLTRLNGEGIRWVKKGNKEYGIFKGDVCSRLNGVYLMPVWADLKKEFKFEKTMSLVLFKQQLSTQ
jgi:hypothetical protein